MDDGVVRGEDGRRRCWWPGGDPLYQVYHDGEWGRPSADDRRLFEKICLEGFQAGLSWITILRKRDNFRAAFAAFEPRALVRFGAADVERCLADPGLVRHRGKIESVLNNARRTLDLIDEAGSLAAFVWRFEPDPARRPSRLDRAALRGLAATPESAALSKELRRRGFSFVGPTTVYAFMQSVGIVNDHLDGCFCRPAVEAERAAFIRPT